MKATERKELQTNTLKQLGQDLLHGGKRLPGAIWVLPILVVVIGLVYWFWSGIAASRTTNVWAYFWANRDSSDAETEKRLKGTVAELSWQFEKADRLYHKGYDALFTMPAQGAKDLQEASKTYEEVAQAGSASPLMVLQSYSGAAKCEECLGEVDRALFFYRALLERFGSDKDWTSVAFKTDDANKDTVKVTDKDWVHPLVQEAWQNYQRLRKDNDERRNFDAKWFQEQLQIKRTGGREMPFGSQFPMLPQGDPPR
jgi:hypothetical protein